MRLFGLQISCGREPCKHSVEMNSISMTISADQRTWVKRGRCILIATLATMAAAPQSGCKANSSATSRAQEASPQPVVRAPAVHANVPAPRLVCPHLGATLTAVQQSSGGHKVTLSWRASRPPDSKHGAAVGYCVYRGPTARPPYPDLLNEVPFPGTRCADDSVESGKKYYYVVRAITVKGITSDVTKPPVAAKIPTAPSRASQVSQDFAPLCRESTGLK